MHDSTCGVEHVVSLYRRLQRKGYYWPEMKKDADSLQANCPECQKPFSTKEVLTTTVIEDWRAPYIEYLVDSTLPKDSK